MKRVQCVTVFLGILVFCFGVGGFADGVDAGSFARDGIGARAFGLGGAFVSIADDASTTVWNPAGLAQLDGVNMGGMYTNKFGVDIYFQSLGATARFSNLCAGLTMVRSSIEDIPFYGDGEGEFFSETQTLYLASLGYNLSGVLSLQTGSVSSLLVGGNVKYYSHTLLEGKGSGLGFDLGALAKFSFNWGDLSLGFASLDIGGTALRWSGTDHNPVNNVPWINKVGGSVVLLENSLRLAADADIAIGRSYLNRLHLGAEYLPIAEIGVRAGVVFGVDGSQLFTAGGSVEWRGISLDYAYIPHQALGESHILSAQFYFAGWWEEESDDANTLQ